jgi:hypothetical protein
MKGKSLRCVNHPIENKTANGIDFLKMMATMLKKLILVTMGIF